MKNKDTVLILGSPGITQLMSSTLAGKFDIQTLSPTCGAQQFDAMQARSKLGQHPNIRKLFVVPGAKLCEGAKQIIVAASRLGKPSTVIADPNDKMLADNLREQSAAVGAGFMLGDFSRESLLTAVTSAIESSRVRAYN